MSLLLLLGMLVVVFGWAYRSSVRGMTDRSPVAAEKTEDAVIPPNLTLEEYAANGLRSLQIMLVQQARRRQD